MKKSLLLLAFALLLIPTTMNSQTQKGINYQAVAHNSNGTVLDNKPVGLRFSFIKGPLPGTHLYVETHSISTNKFGLFSVVMGKGQVITGTFSTIDWNSGDIYLKVEIDPAGGTNFSEVSTTLLQTVPYALNSEKANLAEGLSPDADGYVKSINGTEGVVTLEGGGGTTINKSGQKITISSSGGSGNGIQGIQNTDGNISITNPNGPTATINFSAGATAYPKGPAGGDLTGTYPNPTIGDGKVNNAKISDVAWSKITGVPSLGGAKCIDELTDGKSDSTSVFLGFGAGDKDDKNNRNTAVGINSLKNNISGELNVAIGYMSLYNSTDRSDLVAIGASALYNNGTGATDVNQAAYNTAVGSKALFSNTTGFSNTASGYYSMTSNTTGSDNTAYGCHSMESNISGVLNSSFGSWSLNRNTTGNENTAIGVNALRLNKTGSYNTAVGVAALSNDSTGSKNTAIGSYALVSNKTGNGNTANGYNALYSNTTGSSNTAQGSGALYWNTTGGSNTAIGFNALGSVSAMTGSENTAVGYKALASNTTGSYNTAIGLNALYSNTTGYSNTAIGLNALYSNTTGYSNTANGRAALYNNTTGSYNTANGLSALSYNTTGSSNTANGRAALCSNTSGWWNTAMGDSAMTNNTKGVRNTAVGYLSMLGNTYGGYNTALGQDCMNTNTRGNGNVAVGTGALNGYELGNDNVGIGNGAGVNGANYSNTITIGANARATGSNQVRIGNSSIWSIGGFVNWTNLSDGRFKYELKEDVIGLNFIMKLKPLTYQLNLDNIATCNKEGINSDESYLKYRQEKSKIRYSGFIAQEVELAAKSVGYDFSGVDIPKNENDFYGLRYAEFVVPLIKAVQEQQEIIIGQQKEIADLTKRLELLEKMILNNELGEK